MEFVRNIILYSPIALITLVVSFLPIHGWLKATLFGVFIFAGFFQRELYLEEGRIVRRKRMELAFCSVFFLSSLSLINPVFQFWPFVPFFLLLVWLDFPLKNLFYLSLLFVGLSRVQFRTFFGMDQYLVFVLSVLCALLFRFVEKQKKNKLQKRLDAFETFEKRLSSTETGAIAHLQAKKESKVGELVQQRKKRFLQFVNLIDSLFVPHTVLIYTFDPLREEFDLQEFKSKDDQIDSAQSQPLQGFFKAAQSRQKPIVFNSQTEIKHLTYYKKTPALASVVAVPIYHQSLLTGLIVVDHQERPFSRGHVEVLEKIAVSISDFLHDIETMYSYFRLKEELSSFYSASSSLNQAFRLQDVFDVFLKTSRDIVPYDLSFLIMLDPTARQNSIVAQFGEFENWVGDTFALSPSRGIVSWVIENQKSLFYDGYRQRYEHSPLFHKKMKLPNIFQSVCIFPLKVKEEILGAVVFLSEADKCFSASSRKILEVLSMQASISIKNAKMVRDLEQLATTDGLTGLVNHRTFQKQMILEIERAKRRSSNVSLIFVDLDHFKRINDNYGHPTGDFVLKEVAKFLNHSVRNVDYVARYGGEEFAIILPDTTSEDALMMAQRMGAEMRKKEMVDQGISLKVTFSIGIATYPEHAILKEQIIDFADTALYHSKKTGRNKATLYTKNLKMVDFADKEHILIEKAEKILQEQ